MCKEKLKTLWMQEFILTPSHHCAASLTYDDGQYSVDLTPALISHHTHAAGIIVYRQLSPPEQKTTNPPEIRESCPIVIRCQVLCTQLGLAELS